MRLRRTSLTALLLTLLALAPAGASGLVDPRFRFREIRTEHFIIYFHQGEDRLAGRLAAMVEDVRARVGEALHAVPPHRTHVLLVDQSELANGWATPLPRDTVFLNAATPSGADFIGRTDDWLRLVFTHEYTHIVHLDRSSGWARVVRGIFGRAPIAFPNLLLPEWQIEGLATWEESAIAGAGRLSAGDFRAIERVPAAEGRSLTLDRASGGLVRWPDGHAAYASGLGFHAYLAERFGEASFGTLADSTSRSLPFLGSRAFRRVYGESLGSLWREYSAALLASATSPAPADSPPRRLTYHGNVVVAPRFAPPACMECPNEIIYSMATPDAFPSLRAIEVGGVGDRKLATRYHGATTGVSARAIVFDQQELRRNVALHSDLYALDRESGDVRALTRGARLQDPDLSPDGRSIVAVRESAGERGLVLVRLSARADDVVRIDAASVMAITEDVNTQFSAPRWSPDGRLVAVERRRLGALPDVVVLDPDTRQIQQVLADGAARIVTPTWRPDGRAVIAAADFDGGPFDLYEFALDGGGTARRLTRTNGAFWPDVSADGRMITFAGYTADGYDVFTTAYAIEPRPGAGISEARGIGSDGPGLRADEDANTLSARRYSPFGTVAPTSWTPLVQLSDDQTRVGASVAGVDVLGRHAYAVNVSWRVDGPTVVRPLPQSAPDWSAAYAYTRHQPSFFGSASRETTFGNAVVGSGPAPMDLAVVERELQAGVFLPMVHVRRSAQAAASLVRTERQYRLPDREQTATLVSSRLAFAHDSTQQYGYSVSREHGANIGVTVELAREALGSQADATTATLDARAYVPGFGLHHVVAVRAAAGGSRGSAAAQQTFRLGEVAASPSVIDFGSDALGLFRGVSGSADWGTRLVVANVEYRLPLAVLERGRGTWPLFLRTAHASIFVDAGQLRGGNQANVGWRRAVGGELSLDAVAGYVLPFAASAGVAWGHDGRAPRGVSVYARLGRSF